MKDVTDKEDGTCEDCDMGGASGVDEEGEPLSPVSQCASYDRLNPYSNLGDVEPVNLISFAYQIASGMVCVEETSCTTYNTYPYTLSTT